ncbi:hypothetical protein [Streptomyces sp. NPDC054834]
MNTKSASLRIGCFDQDLVRSQREVVMQQTQAETLNVAVLFQDGDQIANECRVLRPEGFGLLE